MRIFWDLNENGTIAKQYYERRCNERTTCITRLYKPICQMSTMYLIIQGIPENSNSGTIFITICSDYIYSKDKL